jgi:hypothetical protein
MSLGAEMIRLTPTGFSHRSSVRQRESYAVILRIEIARSVSGT